jgi:hypothetical protein
MPAALEVKTRLRRQNRWMSLRHWPATLGLVCQLQWGCYYHDQEGQSQSPPYEPSVVVFDYRISSPSADTSYAIGCGATGQSRGYSQAVAGAVPLDTEYLFEVTSIRVVKGTPAEQDAGYLCQLPYQATSIGHTNPSCLQSVPGSNVHELIEASVVDTAGNALTSKNNNSVSGSSTDVERYIVRSHAFGVVNVSLAGAPCSAATEIVGLLTIESP